MCAIVTLMIVAFFRHQIFLSIILLSITSIAILLIDGNKRTTILFIIVFFLGPIAESFAIYHNAWTYDLVNYKFNFPIYLAFVWGNAAIFIRNLELRIIKSNNK